MEEEAAEEEAVEVDSILLKCAGGSKLYFRPFICSSIDNFE